MARDVRAQFGIFWQQQTEQVPRPRPAGSSGSDRWATATVLPPRVPAFVDRATGRSLPAGAVVYGQAPGETPVRERSWRAVVGADARAGEAHLLFHPDQDAMALLASAYRENLETRVVFVPGEHDFATPESALDALQASEIVHWHRTQVRARATSAAAATGQARAQSPQPQPAQPGQPHNPDAVADANAGRDRTAGSERPAAGLELRHDARARTTMVIGPASTLRVIVRDGQQGRPGPAVAQEIADQHPEILAAVDGPMFDRADGSGANEEEHYRTYTRARLHYLYEEDGQVLAEGASGRAGEGLTLSIADDHAVMLPHRDRPPGVRTAVQLYPPMVHHGANVATRERNHELTPRAAAGILGDGRVFLAVTASGIGIPDFADVLIAMGAVEAGYTDGGGSRALFVRDGSGGFAFSVGIGGRRARRVASFIALAGEARPGVQPAPQPAPQQQPPAQQQESMHHSSGGHHSGSGSSGDSTFSRAVDLATAAAGDGNAGTLEPRRAPQPPGARSPSLDADPYFMNRVPVDTSSDAPYTDYSPRPYRRVLNDMLNVSRNGSFISRMLRVISRCDRPIGPGGGKNFETITGQDGLTFGVTDFTGFTSFVLECNRTFPDATAAAFGSNLGNALNAAWTRDHNHGGNHSQGANDRGLITLPWVRHGLDRLLTDPRLRGFQLSQFNREKTAPCLRYHQQAFARDGWRGSEFSLAVLVGIANSFGPGVIPARYYAARASLSPAPADPLDLEIAVARAMLMRYGLRDGTAAQQEQMRAADRAAFGEGSMPSDERLGHSGRRAWEIYALFPPRDRREFRGMGTFTLEPDERFAADPTTR